MNLPASARHSAHSREGGNPDAECTAPLKTGSPPSRGRAGNKAHSRSRIILLAACLVCVSAIGGAAWWIASLGPAPLGNDIAFSTRVLDHDGRLLRAYATGEGRWRLPARIAD